MLFKKAQVKPGGVLSLESLSISPIQCLDAAKLKREHPFALPTSWLSAGTVHSSAIIPQGKQQQAWPPSYLAEEPEDRIDLGMQDMDGGQQPVPVAPEQLVHAADGEQGLLVQKQQHLRGKLQRG